MASGKRELGSTVPKADPELTRKNLERMKFAKALHERCRWSVQEFAEKLQLEDAGICGKTECGTSHISEAHFQRVFPKKGGSGMRVVANEFLTEADCGTIWQQYLLIYNHPPPNKEYARYFLRSWLAEREGKATINWAKFAHDICRKQYVSWQKDGRVEEALNTKWDEIQGIKTVDIVGQGASQTGERRQVGTTCEPASWTEEQNSHVVQMLGDAEADRDSIGSKLCVLEHRSKELQQQCKGIDGALAERQKSLREEELSCANMRRRRESLLEHFKSIRGSVNSESDGDSGAGEIGAEEGQELRTLDKDLEFGVHILNRESARTEQLRSEQEGLESDLKKVETEIHLRGVASARLEVWVTKLTEQVQMMAVGSGMGTNPLPIKNPRVPGGSRSNYIYISNCPVCGFNFKCHNISVADCSCTYHHFCLAAWLSDGKRSCASGICPEEFSADWLDSFGANQLRLPALLQPKMEGPISRFSLGGGNVAAAGSTNFQVESASGTPISATHMGARTPSSGQVRTPASYHGWKTPSSSAGKVAGGNRVGRQDPSPSEPAPGLTISGTQDRPVSLSGKTSDETELFPETEEVCLSQAQQLPHAIPEHGQKGIHNTVVPETLPEDQAGIVNDDVDIADTQSKENNHRDEAMSEGNDRESSPTPKGVYELALPATEFQSLDGDTGSPENHADPDSSPSPENLTSHATVPHRSTRVAALRNTLCPTPGVTIGGTSETGKEAGTKKVTVGRGRANQGAGRAEKHCNMKPLAHIGLQEKFRAPAVVSDAGKGRGRGGKAAKRKRDGGT